MTTTTNPPAVDRATWQRQREQEAMRTAVITPEQGAARLGLLADDVTAELDKHGLAPFADRILTDAAWTARQAQGTVSASGAPPGPTVMLAAVVAEAQTRQAAAERAAAAAEQRDRDRTCAVTGQVDPTTYRRRLPWAWNQPDHLARLSDRGYLAVLAAALDTLTDDELERARGIVASSLAPAATPEPAPKRGRRK